MSRGKYITQEQRVLALSLYKTGKTQAEVADEMKISVSAVSRIIKASGYDRTHVGSSIAKAIPTANVHQSPPKPRESRPGMKVISRTQKLQSAVTGFCYTVSTESDVIDIESDSALMQINVSNIDAFVDELVNIKKMLGNPQ